MPRWQKYTKFSDTQKFYMYSCMWKVLMMKKHTINIDVFQNYNGK